MAEEQVFFVSDNIKLEGLLQFRRGNKGVAVTHPHPLFGGSMHNGVVQSLVDVYRQAGYTTLRFNFRGVGSSRGEYDQGKGEQKDVQAALNYLVLRSQAAIDLAGYSFGAWVNALLQPAKDIVKRMIMISPPVAFLDFAAVQALPQLELVIAGSQDQIAPPELIKTALPNWNPLARLEVIEGADHFYGWHTGRLESILAAHLRAQPI